MTDTDTSANTRSSTGKDDTHPQQALEALRRAFGFRLEAGPEEGRRHLVAAVAERLRIDESEARDAVFALEHAGAIRYEGPGSVEAVPVGGPMAAAVPPPAGGPGHWRIGEPG